VGAHRDSITMQRVPCFVELSLNDEHRNDLEDKRDHDEEEDENAKHLVLQALLGVVCHEEGKADEQ
jgi:hypothetical protein